MPGLKKDEYDVIIIGAGIGGLVCGCYLAKAGMKVLIVEKNDKPGGYCTSFENEGYRFDVCAHGLGGLNKDGNLRKIIDELNLNLNIKRLDPSDILITPDYEISFWNDLNKTIHNFQDKFPNEADHIKSFFDFINNTRLIELFRRLKQKTFKQLLDEYFKEEKLKKILSFPLGNLGISYQFASALITTIFYREFMINGGYYPLGGMQALPNSLTKRFKEFGGTILFSKKAEEIKIKNSLTTGITIDKNIYLKSKYVVSNCDIKQTYFKLIGKNYLSRELATNLNKKIISPSTFVVYIGLKDNFKSYFTERGYALWYMPTYNIDNIYLHNKDINDIDINKKDIFCALGSLNTRDQNYNRKNIHLLIIAPFKNKKFWRENKYKLANDLLQRLEKLIPSLKKYIITQKIATPIDFFNYTFNCKGSAYGWAATTWNDNISINNLIKNLFIVGHWTSNKFGSSGINTVAFLGYNVSQTIIKDRIT
jgi:prolycopene isomerase